MSIEISRDHLAKRWPRLDFQTPEKTYQSRLGLQELLTKHAGLRDAEVRTAAQCLIATVVGLSEYWQGRVLGGSSSIIFRGGVIRSAYYGRANHAVSFVEGREEIREQLAIEHDQSNGQERSAGELLKKMLNAMAIEPDFDIRIRALRPFSLEFLMQVPETFKQLGLFPTVDVEACLVTLPSRRSASRPRAKCKITIKSKTDSAQVCEMDVSFAPFPEDLDTDARLGHVSTMEDRCILGTPRMVNGAWVVDITDNHPYVELKGVVYPRLTLYTLLRKIEQSFIWPNRLNGVEILNGVESSVDAMSEYDAVAVIRSLLLLIHFDLELFFTLLELGMLEQLQLGSRIAQGEVQLLREKAQQTQAKKYFSWHRYKGQFWPGKKRALQENQSGLEVLVGLLQELSILPSSQPLAQLLHLLEPATSQLIPYDEMSG